MKIAIIGGVAAGTSAAAKARRENPDAEIVLFEKDNHISYAGCGLPYYISGTAESREKLISFTPREFEKKYKVYVKTKHRVTSISPQKNKINVNNLSTQKSKEHYYDRLILASGARPVKPEIPGIDNPQVKFLRTLNDGEQIKKFLRKNKVHKTAIIGAGYIGLEMAEAFSSCGLEVTLIEKEQQVFPQLSKDMADIIASHLQQKGVRVRCAKTAAGFHQNKNNKLEIPISGGSKIRADLALVSVGISPRTELAEKAGIKLGPTGAVSINEKMETSVKNIYAAGDCAESRDLISGAPAWVPLGSTANKQGRTAGGNAAGGAFKHRGILKTALTKTFELTAARTGLSEAEAEKLDYNYISVKIQDSDHAGYYPGTEKIHIKGLFDKDSHRLLGAEIIGKKGVDKRLDVLCTALYSGLTADDLYQLDLGYAPPYSSPKDPAAVLGMVAQKKLND